MYVRISKTNIISLDASIILTRSGHFKADDQLDIAKKIAYLRKEKV